MSNFTDSHLAFLFPGQGSQSVGMLVELAEVHPEVTATFRTASDILGYDLWGVVRDGPAERLNSTEVTQPAMLTAGVAAWRVWCAVTDRRPAWMAGHSLGEYTALVCAGALEFEGALHLVAERARLMQCAVPADVGAMAAVLGLGDEAVSELCNEASTPQEIVRAANFNAPGQVVIAGQRGAVERAMAAAKAAGAKRSVLLPVSVPSHCPLMQPAAEQLLPLLRETPFAVPAIPVVHNIDAAPRSEVDRIREALYDQLSGSVLWAQSVAGIAAKGAARFVECGPGRVLAGLNKRIVATAPIGAIYDSSSLAQALELTS